MTLKNVMLSVIYGEYLCWVSMLSVANKPIMLRAIMLSVVMLYIVMLNVVMLIVVAPQTKDRGESIYN